MDRFRLVSVVSFAVSANDLSKLQEQEPHDVIRFWSCSRSERWFRKHTEAHAELPPIVPCRMLFMASLAAGSAGADCMYPRWNLSRTKQRER